MTKTENKSVKVILSKAASDGQTVTAVVSSNAVDRDGEIVDNPSLRLPLKGGGTIPARALTGSENLDVPFLINHSMDVEDVIGSVQSAQLNAQGELEMTFSISSLEKAQSMFTLLEEGHLDNAFSITFFDCQYVDGKMIDGEILEVSLVWRGSNPDARLLSISKSFGENTKEVETEETTVKEEPVEETETNIDKETNKETETEVVTDDIADKEDDKKEIKMTKEEIAAQTTVEAKEVVATQAKPVAVSKRLVRENFAKQIGAFKAQKPELLSKFAQEGAKLEGVESKTLDLSSVYLSTIVANDIKAAYTDAGGVGPLVNRLDITGADIYKGFYETNGVGFQAVSLGGEKQQDAPNWLPVSITPYEYALIVAWQDDAAERTPLAVYTNVVRYIANQYKRLEDKIILTQAAQTVDGESRPATGLAPLLEAAARSSAISTDLAAQHLVPALATAYGKIKSDGTLTIVANRSTWAQMATAQDANYNTVFQVVGKQVTIGALGTFNVVTSEALSDNEIVVGNLSDYTLVTRGALSTLFSQEATVGELNLFTMDASALRAKANIAGNAVPLTSFWLLTGAGFVSQPTERGLTK